MFVCGLSRVKRWCWHPNMPPYAHTFERDDAFQKRLSQVLLAFCDDLDEMEAFAKGKGVFHLAEKLKLSDEICSAEVAAVMSTPRRKPDHRQNDAERVDRQSA